MMRLVLILLVALVPATVSPVAAQAPVRAEAAPPAISTDQARAALDVLNDPAKRAAFAATLNALINAQAGHGCTRWSRHRQAHRPSRRQPDNGR